jgi:hypothetical protein
MPPKGPKVKKKKKKKKENPTDIATVLTDFSHPLNH